MKREIIALVVFFSLTIFNYAHANKDCATRRAEIERELHIAQQYSNVNKIAGLNEALIEVDNHCSRESQLEEVQHDTRRLQNKIVEKNEDIQNLTYDLRRAEARNDRIKVEKIRRKIENKKDELREVQKKLDALLRDNTP